MSDRIGVMYLGRLVELADRDALFSKPLHPYTRMLLDAIPHLRETGRARTPVRGEVPSPLNPPSGCAFHPRCPRATDECRLKTPELKTVKFFAKRDSAPAEEEPVRSVACHHPL